MVRTPILLQIYIRVVQMKAAKYTGSFREIPAYTTPCLPFGWELKMLFVAPSSSNEVQIGLHDHHHLGEGGGQQQQQQQQFHLLSTFFAGLVC